MIFRLKLGIAAAPGGGGGQSRRRALAKVELGFNCFTTRHFLAVQSQ